MASWSGLYGSYLQCGIGKECNYMISYSKLVQTCTNIIVKGNHQSTESFSAFMPSTEILFEHDILNLE